MELKKNISIKLLHLIKSFSSNSSHSKSVQNLVKGITWLSHSEKEHNSLTVEFSLLHNQIPRMRARSYRYIYIYFQEVKVKEKLLYLINNGII
jgi:DUF2075 family protein